MSLCRDSSGNTGCTTNCTYGPCGAANLSTKGTSGGHVFHPTSQPTVCGWDDHGAGGLGTDYSPEHYSTTGGGTMGETQSSGSDDSGNSNTLIAQSATLAQASNLESLSFYVTTAAGKLRLGIYDATGPSGGPGAKLAEAAEITPVAGWNTARVGISVPAGTYWLAYFASSDTLGFKVYPTGSNQLYGLTYALEPGMPATFSTAASSGTAHWSFYATWSTAQTLYGSVTPTCTCTGCNADGTPSGCGTGVVAQRRPAPNDAHVYLFYTNHLTWDAARTECLNQGYALTTVNDATENTWLAQTANTLNGTVKGWIGASDIATEGTWVWLDGTQFWQGAANGSPVGGRYSNWKSGEPNDSDPTYGEDCAELEYAGTWNDTACISERTFVCESN